MATDTLDIDPIHNEGGSSGAGWSDRVGAFVRHSLLARVFGVSRTSVQKIVTGGVYYARRLA